MRKITLIASLLILCTSTESSAQVDLDWSRPYGGAGREEGRAIITTSDHEFYVLAGSSTSRSGASEFYVVKTLTSGNPVWERIYEAEGGSRCCALTETREKGLAFAGYAGVRNHGYEFLLIRTGIDGNPLWSYTYGSPDRHDACYDIINTDNNGFLMIGGSTPLEYLDGDGYVVKTDSSGHVEWERFIGGYKNDFFYCGCSTSDGGYLLGGGSNSYGKGGGFLAKVSNRGDTIWSRIVGRPGYAVSEIISNSDGEYLLTGDDNWGEGTFFMRVNEEGDSISHKYFESYTDGAAMIQTADGGYAITAKMQYQSPLLIKLDSQGNEEWHWVYGHSRSGYTGLIQSADGGYCMVGTSSELSETQDMWLVKTGPVGQFIPAEENKNAPDRFTLLESYPNPFNSSTTLSFSLRRPGWTTMDVMGLNGRLLNRLNEGWMEAGEHSLVWSAPGSGVYFAVLQVEGEGKAVKKVVCVR